MLISLHRILATSLLTIGSATAQSLPTDPDPSAAGHGDPFLPVGAIQVTPNVVREGVQPQMTWEIEYPKSVPDLFDVSDSGTLLTTNPKSDKLGVRIVGSSFGSEGEELPVALWIRVGGPGSSWELLFYGTGSDVDPSQFVYSKTIHAGTLVDFAAKGRSSSNAWHKIRWTIPNKPTVAALVDGDPTPPESLAFSNGETEGFLSQFITEDETIDLGPRELLYLFELDSETPGTSGFDLQDLVIVVSSAKNNNGHGNNLDGVDVSNPGQGHGGPNGQDDPSGSIDDEGKIKKKKK